MGAARPPKGRCKNQGYSKLFYLYMSKVLDDKDEIRKDRKLAIKRKYLKIRRLAICNGTLATEF